jgi:hypothetical protein
MPDGIVVTRAEGVAVATMKQARGELEVTGRRSGR